MDKLLKHLEFLQASSEKTCNYLSDKEINTIPFFCLGLLKRIQDTTTSTKALFEILLQNHNHGFSIGLLLRALIFDSLISMNLMKLINDCEVQGKNTEATDEAVKEFCDKFLSDGLKTTLNYIQDAKTFEMRTAAETADSFKNMGNLYQPYFDNYQDDGTKPKLIFKDSPTARNLFEILAKSTDLKEVSKIYDSYTYLSKYEHFGIVYYNAINEDLDSKLNIFTKAVEAFVGHNAILHFILAKYSQNDEFIKEQSRFVNDYLLKNVLNS
jgi:DNA-binding ferritin-like protein (Dps family)